ncbi:MAG: AMP-binding protein [Dehalococcoidia bacterium]
MKYSDRPWTKEYNDWVVKDPVIPDKTYKDFLEESFKNNPDRPAMYFMGKTITFKELDDLSSRFANFLSRLGYGPGDVVSILTPNIPQNQIANVGTALAGCIAQGISILLTPKEMAYQLNQSGARVLVIWDVIFEQKFLQIAEQVPDLKHIVVCSLDDYLPPVKRVLGNLLKKLPKGKVVPVPSKTVQGFKEMLANHLPRRPRVEVKPEDTCLIQYTGGTTGVPKGAEITHRNLVCCLVVMKNWLDLKERDEVYCSAFPFFHIAGLFVGMINLIMGNPQILIPDPRNPKHFCSEYSKYHPTGSANVPTIYMTLLNTPAFRNADHSRCKAFISAASPLPEQLLYDLEAVVGKGKVLELFGMTETMVTAMDQPKKKKKIGSVGLPWPQYRIKVVDLETGENEVDIGKEGELIVQGAGVMKGYWNRPDETAQTLRTLQDGQWLFTGDIVRMDEEGYLYVVDRVKDMIDVRGFNVFSREVEDVLYQHPAVEVCAVVGAPDPKREGTNLVRAVIQLRPEYLTRDSNELAGEITEHCKSNLAHYKVPATVEFIQQMPLTSLMKINKKALRVKQ